MRAFISTAPKQAQPAMSPIASAPSGPTKPAAGVMATKPATNPDATPRLVGLSCLIHSTQAHETAAAAAAMCVLTSASAAPAPADKALPALKPNQPNQSSPAPSNVSGKL